MTGAWPRRERFTCRGSVFPKDVQCQVEWLVLWRRVAGGLNAGQQNELYQRLISTLGAGGKKQTVEAQHAD